MLTKFEVTNFKNFDKKLTLDLTKSNAYAFNAESVVEGVVNKALIYGHNGVGKSNLGYAMFDLISHLTDKNPSQSSYDNFLNASNNSTTAHFRHEFMFEEGSVSYEYGKTDSETLIYEKLSINGSEFASIDRRINSVASFNAAGAENLKTEIGESKISIISYIKKNSVLEDNLNNKCFFKFISFVNGMLFFRSLERNNYIGLKQGSSEILADIIERDNIENFERFLNNAGIKCKLVAIKSGDKSNIAFDFNGKQIPIFEIASQGTKALALFYFWFQRLEEDSRVTLLFIDEFDAFYHHTLSSLIVNMIKSIHAQAILTTHNTSIISNELLRPDCYFLMRDNAINSLANCTVKDLREAHNIEKMYKAGAFSG